MNFDHIKQHHYGSHASINPDGIVPLGPILDLNRAPDRDLPAIKSQTEAEAFA